LIHQIDLKLVSEKDSTKSLVFIYADSISDKEYLSNLFKNHKLELYEEVKGEFVAGYYTYDNTFNSNI